MNRSDGDDLGCLRLSDRRHSLDGTDEVCKTLDNTIVRVYGRDTHLHSRAFIVQSSA